MIKIQVVIKITPKFIKIIYIFGAFKIFENLQKQEIKLLKECLNKYYWYNNTMDYANYYTESYWGRVVNKQTFHIK